MIRLSAMLKNPLLGSDVHLQHCIGISLEEAKIISETGTHVSSTPYASAFWRRCPVPELMVMGANVVTATDGTAPSSTFDLIKTSQNMQLVHQGFLQMCIRDSLNPDHYPYAMEQENLNALAGRELNQTFDIYQSAAFFYHDGIEPMSVDKYVSSLDLLPTIYNYMGIPYDSRFLSGRDVFNEGEGFVPLLSRSWLTDTGRYNLQTKEFTLHEGQTLEEDEEEYVARMNRLDVYKRQATRRQTTRSSSRWRTSWSN